MLCRISEPDHDTEVCNLHESGILQRWFKQA